MKLAQSHSIGSARILVFDDVFSAPAVKRVASGALRVRKSWKREPRFAFHRILDTRSFARDAATAPLDRVARELIAAHFPRSAGHELSFPAINRIASGALSDVHVDTVSCPDCLACILFANSEWDPAWGAELILFDERREARVAVTPRPGRLVIYPGSVFHRAGVPQANCPVERVTVGVWYRCPRRKPRRTS